jgi:hypothetical protein
MLSTSMIGRTVIVTGYLLAVVLVGRPMWLAFLLGMLLVGVWVAPFVLNPQRRPGPAGVRTVQRKSSAGQCGDDHSRVALRRPGADG